MRSRTVLILLILVVGLVAFIELYEADLPSSDERARRAGLLLPLELEEIEAVELRWPEETVRLERRSSAEGTESGGGNGEGGRWWLVEPLAAEADASLVQSLIDGLVELEKGRVLDDLSAAEAGLDDPRLRVALLTGEREWVLAIGSPVPAGDSMLVSLAGDDEIVVVDDSLWTELERPGGGWRSRRVLPGADDGFSAITLLTGSDSLTLERRGDEFWVSQPFVDLADAERVGTLTTGLASMTVAQFADEWPDASTDPGLEPPIARFEVLIAGESSPRRISWGRRVTGSEELSYAATSDMVFTTATDLGELLETNPQEWRALELVTLEPFQIDSLTVTQPGFETLSLNREGAQWNRNGEQISFPTVSDFLYVIAELDALGVEAPVPAVQTDPGPAGPLLELFVEGAGRQETVRFHRAGEAGVRASPEGRDVVLLVGSDEFTEILTKVDQIRHEKTVKEPVDEQLVPTDSGLSPDQ